MQRLARASSQANCSGRGRGHLDRRGRRWDQHERGGGGGDGHRRSLFLRDQRQPVGCSKEEGGADGTRGALGGDITSQATSPRPTATGESGGPARRPPLPPCPHHPDPSDPCSCFHGPVPVLEDGRMVRAGSGPVRPLTASPCPRARSSRGSSPTNVTTSGATPRMSPL
jgi:hypothetical protein